MTQAPTLDWPEGLRPAPAVHAFPLADGLVLWNEGTDEVHHLNPTASLVWEAIVDERPLAELGDRFGDAHPDGAEGIRRDVEEVVTQFETTGLLVGAGDEPAPATTADEPASPASRRGQPTGLGRAIEQGMADRVWSAPLGPYSLGGYRFEIVAEDTSLLPTIDLAFAGLADPDASGAVERVWIRTRRNQRVPYSIIHGDRRAALTQDVTGVILETLRDLSRTVFTQARYLVLHAAAVADEHGAIVIVGKSGAGKSTMGAALVERGLRYLADETVVIDPETLEVVPVLRPLKLELAGRNALDELIDGVPPRMQPVNEARTLRAPAEGVATHERAPIRTIIFSEFKRDGEDRVQPLVPVDSLRRLLDNRYASGLDASEQLQTLLDIAAEAACYRLERASLDVGLTLVTAAHHDGA